LTETQCIASLQGTADGTYQIKDSSLMYKTLGKKQNSNRRYPWNLCKSYNYLWI